MPTVEAEERINNEQVPKTESAVKTEEESGEAAAAAAEEDVVDAERGQGGQNDRGQHHDEL